MRRLRALLLALLVLFPSAACAAGNQGTANYIYTYWHGQQAVPPAYTLEASLTAGALGLPALDGLADLFVAGDAVYALCASRLIVLDDDLSVRRVVESFDNGGTEEKLADCAGIFVTNAGDYYITQPEQARILHFEADGSLRRVLARPEIVGFEAIAYRPTKLAVDSAGRIFVVAKGMYEGIVELRPDGAFSRFFGVNKVLFTVVDMLWRMVATEAQRSRMSLWLPTDFTNLAIDSDGFVFATVQGSENERAVMRLNAKGENILKMPADLVYPMGDENYPFSGAGIPVGRSEFIAVDTNGIGMFIALDSKRARVFAYNEDGRLLFVFGGLGDRQGLFRNPVDAVFLGDRIVVIDRLAQSIDVFAPTKYGGALLRAVEAQHHFDYETADTRWREALDYNPNLTIAYAGIGRSLLRQKRYEEAMEYLRAGQDRTYYTKAFEKVRNATIRAWFVPGALGLAGLCVLTAAGRRLWRKKSKRSGKAVAA